MTNHPQRANSPVVLIFCLCAAVCGFTAHPAAASDAPAWMHALTSVPLPEHDEKTAAVILYSEDITTVQPNGKIKTLERRAYKILRPEGKEYGLVKADMDSETRITGMRGWCIPAQGKDYEVKEKEAVETALTGLQNGELVNDFKSKFLRIPAADPGNIVGYELEHENRPYVLQDVWLFQEVVPVREARYTLNLPPGWEYKAFWINHAETSPALLGSNQIQWVLTDAKAIRPEQAMPPRHGVFGSMVVSLFPRDGGLYKGFADWDTMGKWQANLANGRREVSPEIKMKVAELTSSAPTLLAKMRALARFMQKDIRYVAIQLGIGGWQPHPAPEIFTHKFGDCKDKATLLSAMLKEIGVESYYISIDTERGTITPQTPATRWFYHVILAIRLPDDMKDPSLTMIMVHPKLGRLLIFDPTDEFTPFGHLRGALQESYALLVTPDGGELVKVPQLSPATSGIQRTAKMTLTPAGALTGDIVETRLGDSAMWQRMRLKSVEKDADRIKPLESLASESLSAFQITKANVLNLDQTDQPLGYKYALVAPNYAKQAGNLLLVRPRVLGIRSSGLLETKEPRQFPVVFEGPERDTDSFEIALPPGYVVDDLPPAIDLDYSFASYHSKTEATGNGLRYTRSFEIKELSVPMNKMDDLKKFYRIIAGDERNTAVLKPSAK